MRIAIVHPYPVHGRAVGGVTRVVAVVRHLAARHAVTVFAHASGDPDTDASAIRDLASIGVRQKLFPLARPHLARRLRWFLGREPYFVRRNRNAALAAALAAQDRDGGLDVVHIEFAYLAPLLEGIGPRPLRVLAEQETMSFAIERLARLPLAERTSFERILGWQLGKVRRFEAAVLPSFDRVYGITPLESARLRAAGARATAVLPHLVSARTFTPAGTEPGDAVVLFVGSYTHRPNVHAAYWFAERVWPSVRGAAPQACFDVVGPGLAPREQRRLESAGARVVGRVENLPEHYRSAAVFVNPARSGGGMRGKVLEAFACARPVVSTRLGMEGIAAEPGAHYLEADDASTFAEHVLRYLSDPALRRTHGAAARELVETVYDAPIVLSRLESDYEAAVAGTWQPR